MQVRGFFQVSSASHWHQGQEFEMDVADGINMELPDILEKVFLAQPMAMDRCQFLDKHEVLRVCFEGFEDSFYAKIVRDAWARQNKVVISFENLPSQPAQSSRKNSSTFWVEAEPIQALISRTRMRQSTASPGFPSGRANRL